jgi:hypothetical protein
MTSSIPEWWPQDFAAIYESLCSSWNVQGGIIRRQRLTQGKSGAYVAVVSAKIGRNIQTFVLRLIKIKNLKEPLREIDILKRVHTLTASYARRAIPTVLYHFYQDELLAFAQEIAGGGIEFVDTLRNLPSMSSPYACQQIALSLLADFNTGAEFGPTPRPLDQVAKSWLTERQRSPELSRVSSIVLANGTDIQKPSFAYADLILPNPFHLLNSSQIKLHEIIPLLGLLHGDLNGNNILLERAVGETRQNHWLIDFSYFKESSPLLFDHAYLEVGELLQRIEFSQETLIRKIISRCANLIESDRQFTPSADPDLWSSLYHTSFISTGVDKWVEKNAHGQNSDLRKQYLLARVCAALNYANKRHENTLLNVMSLLISAAFAQSLISFLKLPWSKESTPVTLRVPQVQHFYDGSIQSNIELAEFLDGPSSYVVVAMGPQCSISTNQAENLAQAEIQSVIDLSGGKLNALRKEFSERKKRQALGMHTVVPGTSVPDFDPQMSFLWLEVEALEATDAKMYLAWRRIEIPRLREIFSRIKETESSRVLLAVIGFSTPNRVLDVLLQELVDAVGSERLEVCILTQGGSVAVPLIDHSVISGVARHLITEGNVERYIIAQSLVSRRLELQPLTIPRRDDDIGRQLKTLSPEEQAGFAETFELVHSGLANIEAHDGQEPQFDFLQGSVISWREIEDHFDVDRDKFSDVFSRVQQTLSSNRAGSVALTHGAGTGGTTLARRIAWSFKDTYPTVILRRKIAHTAARLQELYSLAGNLPFVAVVESNVVNPSDRNNLFRELKELNLNFCLLDVRRGGKPTEKSKEIYLDRIVTDGEANRFFRKYSAAAPSAREALRDLTTASAAKSYRVPFMYGLFAFNRQFRNLQQFVRDSIENLSDAQKKALLMCALVRAYTQNDFPHLTLARLIDAPPIEIEKGGFLFGEAYGRLVIFTPPPRHARVVHPIIAETVLKTLLAPAVDPKSIIYRERLGQICLELLDLIEKEDLAGDELLRGIVVDLFIARSPWEYEMGRKQFSDLMLELDNKELSQRILTKLTVIYPKEPHFWHHLGRFSSFQKTAEYDELCGYYETAIGLAPHDSLHHHGLGFVTRDEVLRLLRLVKTRKLTFEAVFADIAKLYESGKRNFSEARRLDEDSVYPLVTMTQMSLDICEYFKESRGASSIAEIFTESDSKEEWCQSILSDIHEAFAAYRELCETVNREASYEERLLPRIERLYGRIESSIQMMRDALRVNPYDEFALRRSLAAVLADQQASGSEKHRIERAGEIFDHLEENYRIYPERFRDIRLWFRSYIQLPEFSFSVAAERMQTWQRLYDAVDAFYYGYIIQFFQVEDAKSARIPLVNELIDATRSLASKIERQNSFEWYSTQSLLCPLVSSRALGKWDSAVGFFSNVAPLKRQDGSIANIISPAQGYINVNGLKAFFQPANKFRKGRDEGGKVSFYLGFSYDGPRAWSVEFANNKDQPPLGITET